jgi:hypothetical protein
MAENHKENSMKPFRKTAIVLAIAAILIPLVFLFGCESKGTAEKAGEKIDESVEAVKEAAEEAGDKITGKGPAEKVGEKIDEAVESVKESTASKSD